MFPTLIVYWVYQNQPRRVDLARCQMCHKREAQLVDGSLENLRKKRFMLYHDVYMWCILVYTWYMYGIYHVYWIFIVYHRYINLKKGMEQTHLYYSWYIPHICIRSTYGFDIHGIYHTYTMYNHEFWDIVGVFHAYP